MNMPLYNYYYPPKPKLPKFIPFFIGVILILAIIMFFAVRAHAEIVLSEHFKKSELACHHCQECKVNIELILALEKLRNKVNRPIIITSGYRCLIHNRSIGGAKQSQHLYGNAVDIKIGGLSPTTVAGLAKQCGFTWTKVYATWTHIDIRRTQLARSK
jgi:hypothetical protein